MLAQDILFQWYSYKTRGGNHAVYTQCTLPIQHYSVLKLGLEYAIIDTS